LNTEHNPAFRMEQKRIAAIHDISCVGRCSLTVALPILSAAGFDTSVLPTAVLSTHTGGFAGFTYRDLTEDIAPITAHWKTLGLRFDALYSGFLGSYAQIELIKNFFREFHTENTLVMVDPVMADNGKYYSVYSPEMAGGMARLCAGADIIVPNLTEAAFLLGEDFRPGPYTRAYIEDLLGRLCLLGPRKAVVTGVWFDRTQLGAAAYDAGTGKFSYAFDEMIDGSFHGTGDIFASTLLASLLSDFSMQASLETAVSYTRQCISLTERAGLERRYGVCFERALPWLMDRLGLCSE